MHEDTIIARSRATSRHCTMRKAAFRLVLGLSLGTLPTSAQTGPQAQVQTPKEDMQLLQDIQQLELPTQDIKAGFGALKKSAGTPQGLKTNVLQPRASAKAPPPVSMKNPPPQPAREISNLH